ncbi:hypothetical protein OQA88_9063 [Cercophora sp. LCS_1]
MDSQTCTANARPEVPFVPFLVGLTVWAVVKYILEFAVRLLNPELYEDLKLDIRKRYDLYFGVWLGTMYKVISLTACGTALLTTAAGTDIPGLVRPLTVAEQWCWGCRAVIYVQELPTIASIPELIIHHLLSIAAMIGILNVNMPRRPLYLMWATLLSEFFANSRRLFKFHNRLSPRLTWWFGFAMVVTVLGIRIPGAVVALMWSIRGGFNNVGVFVYVGSIIIYLLYMLKMTAWELDRLKLLIVNTTARPAHIVVADKWKIGLLGIATGIGLVSAELSALMVHESNRDHKPSPAELQSLAWAALQAVAAGLLGAFLSAPLLRLTVKRRGMGVKAPRLSLRGGFLFAALTLLLSPTVPEAVDKTVFLACMTLGFPLLDAFHQVGCYYAGGGGNPTGPSSPRSPSSPTTSPPDKSRKGSKNSPPIPRITPEAPTETLLPLPLIASLLSAALYISVLSLHLAGAVGLYRAVGLVLAVEANIHYEMAMHRQDIQYKTLWVKGLLMAQAAVSVLYVQYTTALTTAAMAGGALFLVVSYLVVSWAMAVLAKPVCRSDVVKTEAGPPGPGSGRAKRGHTGKIAAVVATLLLIGVLGVAAWFDALPTEITDVELAQTSATGAKSALWHAAWSWQFAVSTVGVGLLPVVAVQVLGS